MLERKRYAYSSSPPAMSAGTSRSQVFSRRRISLYSTTVSSVLTSINELSLLACSANSLNRLKLKAGQRLGDISNMKFSDIWDDHLHVVQEKTGSKLAIPLSLRLNAIDWSLRDVVARCRDYAVSPYLIHFFRSTSMAERGVQVKSNTLTMNFSKARDKADINWGDGTPATFHEQRSLAERLYEAEGIDTQKLLGHKSPNQTARYHDDRGKDWLKVNA